MKTLIRFTAQLLVFTAVGYALMWLLFQFAVLINEVTAHVYL